jgi:hypothetical protein
MPLKGTSGSDNDNDEDDGNGLTAKKPTTHSGGDAGNTVGGAAAKKKMDEGGVRVTDGDAQMKPTFIKGDDKREDVLGRQPQDYPTPLLLIGKGKKGCAKTSSSLHLPRPNDGDTVFLTFDRVTEDGMLDKNGQLAHHITEPAVDDELEDHLVTFNLGEEQPGTPAPEPFDQVYDHYPGYVEDDPLTAVVVIDQAMALVQGLNDDTIPGVGNVDNLIIDNAKRLHMDVSPAKTIEEELDGDIYGEMQPHHWGHRTKTSKIFMARAFNVPDHALMLTGRAKKDAMKKKGGTFIETTESATWLKKWKDPAHAIFFHDVEKHRDKRDGGFRPKFTIEVEHTKSTVDHLFPHGKEISVTGKPGYAVFWERAKEREELLKKDDDDDE